MVQGQWFSPGKDISPLLSVRRDVFGRGADALDGESWNVLVFEDGVPAASGRIWYRDGAYWLGDICVAESSRGRRLGDLVLRLLLFKAQSHAAGVRTSLILRTVASSGWTPLRQLTRTPL